MWFFPALYNFSLFTIEIASITHLDCIFPCNVSSVDSKLKLNFNQTGC